MTAAEAIARQAAYENMNHLRQETVRSVLDVLARIDTVHKLDAHELGRLQWAAFSALTSVQVDLKLWGAL